MMLVFNAVAMPTAHARTAAGTIISNTAQLDYIGLDSLPANASSNTVSVVTDVPRTPADIHFINLIPGDVSGFSAPVGPTGCALGAANNPFSFLPDPILLDGTLINPSANQPLVSGNDIFHVNEPVFVQLSDFDQNLDDAIIETVETTITSSTGDEEQLELRETAADSGIFVGYVPTQLGTAASFDCVLQVEIDGNITATYSDQFDATDAVASNALVDPFGLVFNSVTGAPVDGATVTLIDVATGLPATVFGDDGISAYPNVVVTGSTVTDAGGAVYVMPPGGFRFPLIAPGDYRFDIVLPAGFLAPSAASIASLQTLPGAPFALQPGSFLNNFNVPLGPAVNIDIPVDPVATGLFIEKNTNFSVASVGDYVSYQITVANQSTLQTVPNVEVTDILPVGFKLASGSARADGVVITDPIISADGRTMVFAVGDLGPGASLTLQYVTEVTVGARHLSEATNQAIASAPGGGGSNTALATVRMQDDFFADNAFLVGRVLEGSCDASKANDELGVANARIYMEDGRNVVTDDEGRFHFEGVKPGTHVVQLDIDTLPEYLEVFPCADHARFAGRAYSQFVDLRAGALWRVDFYTRPVPPPSGHVRTVLRSRLDADTLQFSFDMQSDTVPITKVRPTIMLPEGLAYVPGSSRLGERVLDDPRVVEGTLIYSLGEFAGGWSDSLSFDATVTNATFSEYVTKATVQFDTPAAKRQRTPTVDNRLALDVAGMTPFEYTFTPTFGVRQAELSVEDQNAISAVIKQWRGARDIKILAVGHSDNVPIAEKNRHEYENNQVLSLARAHAVANHMRDALSLTPAQIAFDGAGEAQPIASNKTESGRAQNRRVELQIWGEKPSEDVVLSVQKGESDAADVVTQDLSLQERAEAEAEAIALPVQNADVTLQASTAPEPEMNELEPGFDLLWPLENHIPPIPAIKVVVKHAYGLRLNATLNGLPLDGTNFEGQRSNKERTLSVSRWRGIDLEDGDNFLVVETIDKTTGKVLDLIERNVHYSGPAVRAELMPEQSTLIADGRTPPIIAVALYDRWGYPARPGAVGKYQVDAPYRSQWEIDVAKDRGLLEVGDRSPTFIVGPDGVARIVLEPTTQSGEAVVRIDLVNQDEPKDIRAWLKPAPRDWIMVGLAHGTVGYNTISDNVVSAEDAGIEEDFYEDGRVAFFAKGQVKGEYLLTVAYDTRGDETADEERLFGAVDPDAFYTIYGDRTEQRFDAASQEKLYLKLERNQFFALFGDFETGMTVTELANYNRSLNGLQSEYHGEQFEYTAFAVRSRQSFIKDEIIGDGTSGLYRLSRTPLVINSEKITIEVRDRFRPEVILESTSQTRHLDYNIDYLAGTLFFKRPVASRDQNLNPIYIVVDYEARDQDNESTVAGGRGAVHLADRQVELGLSAIHEGIDGAEGDVLGLDVEAKLSDQLTFKAEYAESKRTLGATDVDASAYVTELKHQSSALDATVYMREQQPGFGLGQQRATEDGTRKAGVEGRLRLTPSLTINGEYFNQENIESNTTRDVALVETRYQNKGHSLGVGYRTTKDDNLAAGESRESEHVFANASTTAGNFVLRTSTDLRLGTAESVDYATRHVLGVDYKINSSATVFSEYEISDGDDIETQNTRFGVRVQPWAGAQVNSTYNREISNFGPRVYANMGLIQAIQLNDQWSVDIGVDHANTLRGATLSSLDDPDNPNVPPASGSIGDDFTAYYLGGLYRGDHWTYNTRVEVRNADNEERLGWFTGLYREEINGHGFTLRADFINSDVLTGTDVFAGDIRLGWAFRPSNSEWIWFDRLDFIYDKQDNGIAAIESWRIVNNIHANWMWNLNNQLGLHYGAKYARTMLGNDAFTGFTDLIGVDYRHNFNQSWDMGINTSIWHSWNSDVFDYGLGFDVGLSAWENTWISLGYNILGFDDDDFALARYTSQGPYLRFRIKADQDTLGELKRRTDDAHSVVSD